MKLAAYFSTLVRALELDRCLRAAVHTFTHRDLTRALNQWISRAFDEKEEVSKFEGAFRKLRHAETNKAFGRWADYAGEALYAMATLERSMVEMRMAAFGWVVPRWQDYVAYLRAVRKAAQKLRMGSFSKAWESWVDAAETIKAERAERLRVFACMANAKLGQCWRTWCATIEAEAERKEKTTAVLGQFVHQKAAMGFRTWKSLLVDRGALRHAAGYLMNMQLGRAFASWAFNVTVDTQNMHAAAGFRNRNLLMGWNTWVEAVDEIHTQIATLHKLMNFRGAKALRAWAEAAEEAVEQRRLMRHAAMALLHSAMHKGFNCWAQTCAELRNSYRVMRAALDYRLVAALNTWLDGAADRKRAKSVGARIVGTARNKAFNSWIEYVEELKQKRLIATRLREHNRTKAFNSWIEYVEELKQKRLIATRLASRNRVKAFNAWVELWEETSQRRSLMSNLFTSAESRNRVKAFNSWVELWEEASQRMSLLSNFFTSEASRNRVKAFNSWVALWEERVEKRAVASAFFGKNKAKAFNTWAELADDMATKRALIANFVEQSRGKAIRTWRAYSAASKEARRLLRRALGAFGKATLFKAINAWYGATESIQRRKAEAAEAAEAAHADAVHAASAAAAAMAAAEAAMQKAMAEGFHREQQALLTMATPAPPLHAPPPLPPPPPFGSEDRDAVVVLSSRPRTIMERGHDSMDGGYGGGSRLAWGAGRGNAYSSHRRRAWEHEAKSERAIAALDSGRLPSHLSRGGRHTLHRAEERAGCMWGSKMATRAGSYGGGYAGGGGALGIESVDDGGYDYYGGYAGGGPEGGGPQRSLSFGSRSRARSTPRPELRLASQPLPPHAIEAAIAADNSADFDDDRKVVIKSNRPSFAGPGGGTAVGLPGAASAGGSGPGGGAHDLFDAMDRNGDGVVSREEFASYLQGAGAEALGFAPGSASRAPTPAAASAYPHHPPQTQQRPLRAVSPAPYPAPMTAPRTAARTAARAASPSGAIMPTADGGAAGAFDLPGGGVVEIREGPDGALEYQLSVRSPTPAPRG